MMKPENDFFFKLLARPLILPSTILTFWTEFQKISCPKMWENLELDT